MIRNFLVLVALLGLYANSSAAGNTYSNEKPLECNAPDNFHVVSIGTTFVNLEWDSVPGATGYLLLTYDSNGYPVDTLYPVGTSATVTGLQPGTDYYSILFTQCSGGDPGIGVITGVRIDFRTIIVELILQAAGPGAVELEYFNSCHLLPWDVSNDTYWFEIKNNVTNQYSRYRVRRWIVTADDPQVGGVLGGTLTTQHVNDEGIEPPTEGKYVIILLGGEKICEVTFEIIGPDIKICGTIESGYENDYSFQLIARKRPESPPGGGHRSNEGTMPSNFNNVGQNSTFVQNPFSDRLNIFVPEQTNEGVGFQLIDLNGILMSEHYFETGQEQYSFPTEFLPPGFYFLRMETAGKIQTFKVVKSN